jgi:hypothetical protein
LFSEQMNYWINTLKSSTFIAELFFQNVSVSDWKLVAEKIITPEWVQSQVESLFDQLFSFINGDQDELTLKVSMEQVRQRLGGQVGIDTYHEIVEGKPECSQLELIEWMVAPAISLLPICKMPAKQDLPMLTSSDPEQVLAGVLKNWSSSLPGETDLATALDAASLDELRTLFSGIRLAKTISGVLLAASFFFLLLTFISPSVRSLKGWLRLWGVSFMVSGVLIVLFSVLLAVLSASQINTIIGEIKEILHPSVVTLIDGIANQVVSRLVSPIIIPAGILVVVGFGMFGASVLFYSRQAR